LAATRRRSVYIHQMTHVNCHNDLGHDYNTINTVVVIIIIIIVIIINQRKFRHYVYCLAKPDIARCLNCQRLAVQARDCTQLVVG